MLFWIIATLIVLVVAANLAAPLLRPDRARAAEAPDLVVYREQLAEIERDQARGLLGPDDVQRTRTEVSRRLLAADKAANQQSDTVTNGPAPVILALVVLAVLAGSLLLYHSLGAPGYPDIAQSARIAAGDALRADRVSQAEAEQLAPPAPAPDLSAEDAELLERLRAAVRDHPDSLQGWVYLADYEAQVGNYAGAARAQEQVVALRAAAATLADLALMVDLQVAAAGGFVSPEVEQTLRLMLATDPDNLAARYYTGLLYAQTDRPDIAYRLWRAMVEEPGQAAGAPDFHVQLARQQVEAAAFLAGVDYVLPPLADAAPGPTAADIAAAGDLTPQARQEMIAGMVAQLSDRLATQGGPAADWARLVTSLAVLGDLEQSRAIWAEARDVFATDPAAMALLDQAGAEAGLTP